MLTMPATCYIEFCLQMLRNERSNEVKTTWASKAETKIITNSGNSSSRLLEKLEASQRFEKQMDLSIAKIPLGTITFE